MKLNVKTISILLLFLLNFKLNLYIFLGSLRILIVSCLAFKFKLSVIQMQKIMKSCKKILNSTSPIFATTSFCHVLKTKPSVNTIRFSFLDEKIMSTRYNVPSFLIKLNNVCRLNKHFKRWPTTGTAIIFSNKWSVHGAVY